MDANAISHQDMAAFALLNKFEFHAWEVETIEVLDRVVRYNWVKGREDKQDDKTGAIPASNIRGIKTLFRDLKARRTESMSQAEVE